MADEVTMGRARRLAQETARASGPAERIGRSGRHTMRLPADAFFGAIDANGGVGRDGKTCWDDPTWVRDQGRLYPEVCVRQSGRIFVGARGTGRGPGRNRFGRVTWRRGYS